MRRHLELRHFAKPGVKKERKNGKFVLVVSYVFLIIEYTLYWFYICFFFFVANQKKATSGTLTASTNTTTVSTNTIPTVQSVQALHTLQTVQVKKDPDSSAMTPVTVTVAGTGQAQHIQTHHHQQNQQQQTHQATAIIDQTGHITTTNSGQQQIVTQTENTDGTTSLSIAHVQTLPGHQLTLGSINQVNISNNNFIQ